jgi:hypothetical protein
VAGLVCIRPARTGRAHRNIASSRIFETFCDRRCSVEPQVHSMGKRASPVSRYPLKVGCRIRCHLLVLGTGWATTWSWLLDLLFFVHSVSLACTRNGMGRHSVARFLPDLAEAVRTCRMSPFNTGYPVVGPFERKSAAEMDEMGHPRRAGKGAGAGTLGSIAVAFSAARCRSDRAAADMRRAAAGQARDSHAYCVTFRLFIVAVPPMAQRETPVLGAAGKINSVKVTRPLWAKTSTEHRST